MRYNSSTAFKVLPNRKYQKIITKMYARPVAKLLQSCYNYNNRRKFIKVVNKEDKNYDAG